ncbi:MAG: ABC transporter permease [Deltaproteobacteria bacterium]|nr:ABC transporter permease [Deltaproteobacteria bacterium]
MSGRFFGGLSQRVSHLGEWAIEQVLGVGVFALMALRTFRALFAPRFPWPELWQQWYAIAIQSLPIVGVTALFTGMVLALQSAEALSRFGAKPYVGSLVSLSVVRELGPVLTALMVAGRIGAGIAAEIGSMRVTEQVDAIRAMGADPLQKLVVPRMLAATSALPLLAIVAIFLGVIGGGVISSSQLHLTPNFYLQTVTTTVTVEDLLSGLSKTFFFGWIIAMVGCHAGLTAQGGTEGVGKATTRSVVVGSISIFIADFFLTKAFLML